MAGLEAKQTENGGFGASAAAPIARKIMDAYLLPRLPAGTPPGKPTGATPAATPEEIPAQGAVAPPDDGKATVRSKVMPPAGPPA